MRLAAEIWSSKPFLTARWSNLVLLTFEVPEALIRSHIHPSLEPDLLAGKGHVSLVAFDFQNTRLLGWRVPGYVTFSEVNLRTYVRHGGNRGVSFIRELVPRRAIAWLARAAYNEPYRATFMRSRSAMVAEEVTVEHRWRWAGQTFALSVRGGGSYTPAADSVEHHFKEQSWGYGTSRRGNLVSYRVDHPVWAIRELRHLDYDIDFDVLYGREWAFLNSSSPVSRIFAVGSEVTVTVPQ